MQRRAGLFRIVRKIVQTGLLFCMAGSLMVLPGSISAPVRAIMMRNAQGSASHATMGIEPMSPQGVGDCAAEPVRQLRAVWIATVVNIDWPSRPGLDREEQQREFRTLLDQVQQMHLNAVVVQVKPTADAFYPSRFGPWSQYLTGEQGKDPGYDPLGFMLAETHKRHLAFHAWFNPYRVSMQDDINALSADHPARQHPDWVVSYGGKLYYNPGIPEVRSFIVGSVLEVVRRYAIDGVHLDDYFYPYPVAGQDFPDEETYERYGAATFADRGDWRRDNVNRLVQELSEQIHAANPHVSFGISPFGVWRNQTSDPTGSDTQALENYDALYADTRTWIRHNWLDYIAPQLYWPIGYDRADYEKLVDWWVREVAGTRVRLYIGQAAYKIQDWDDEQEMDQQLRLNQRYETIQGSIFFSQKDLLKNLRGFTERLVRDFYACPAQVPD